MSFENSDIHPLLVDIVIAACTAGALASGEIAPAWDGSLALRSEDQEAHHCRDSSSACW